MQRRFGPIMQNAFVVPDLEAAVDHWTRVMHVGPFYLFEHVPFAEYVRETQGGGEPDEVGDGAGGQPPEPPPGPGPGGPEPPPRLWTPGSS